jgi:hypothetical protein
VRCVPCDLSSVVMWIGHGIGLTFKPSSGIVHSSTVCESSNDFRSIRRERKRLDHNLAEPEWKQILGVSESYQPTCPGLSAQKKDRVSRFSRLHCGYADFICLGVSEPRPLSMCRCRGVKDIADLVLRDRGTREFAHAPQTRFWTTQLCSRHDEVDSVFATYSTRSIW